MHASHERFSIVHLSMSVSLFPRREMICFAVEQITWARDDKFSILVPIFKLLTPI